MSVCASTWAQFGRFSRGNPPSPIFIPPWLCFWNLFSWKWRIRIVNEIPSLMPCSGLSQLIPPGDKRPRSEKLKDRLPIDWCCRCKQRRWAKDFSHQLRCNLPSRKPRRHKWTANKVKHPRALLWLPSTDYSHGQRRMLFEKKTARYSSVLALLHLIEERRVWHQNVEQFCDKLMCELIVLWKTNGEWRGDVVSEVMARYLLMEVD